MTDAMKRINLDDIADGAPFEVTPEIRELLGRAYDAGAFEAAVAPSAPGDPAAAEREATEFAVAATLLLDKDEQTGKRLLRAILDKHLARKG